MIVLLLSACSSSEEEPEVATLEQTETTTLGSATVGGTATSSSEVEGDGQDAANRYSACIREAGLTGFPDIRLDDPARATLQQLFAAGINPDSKAFLDAHAACSPNLGGASGLDEAIGPEGRDEIEQILLEFSECMRRNGFADFPDPDLTQGLGPNAYAAGLLAAGIDPFTASFTSTTQSCQRELGFDG